MNKKLLTSLALIVTSGLVLSACSLTQKTADKMVEQQIEAQTGGDAKVNTEEGKMTIKTDEGQVEYSADGVAKLPEGFPGEMVMGDETKVTVSSVSDKTMTVVYSTTSSQESIFEEFKALPELGWKKDLEMVADSGKILSFSMDNRKVTVAIGPDNESGDETGKTVVSVVVAEE